MSSIIWMCSHPIQYFSPLFAYAYDRYPGDLEVWYASKHGLEPTMDRQFQQMVKWDIPMLSGYKFLFLTNCAPKPSIYSFWGLMNLGVVNGLRKAKKGLVVVHGWNYFVSILTVLSAKLFGHSVCLRCEMPLSQEMMKSTFKRRIKRLLLGKMFFKFIDYYLYIGTENKHFYKYHGVPDHRLVPSPYCVDNSRFQKASNTLIKKRHDLRSQLGISPEARVILYSGKFIDKKRPMDLLEVCSRVKDKENIHFVFMGDGALRSQMESFIDNNDLNNVSITGFVNQSKVTEFYALADIFTMCSGLGETWGLSVNEAMNFGLPVLVSDVVGCSKDLVDSGINGFVYTMGDVGDMEKKLRLLLDLSDNELQDMGEESLRIINNFSFEQVIEGLKIIAS